MMLTSLRKPVLVAITGISVAVAGVAVAGPRTAGARGNTQQQTCPLPLLGADPDTVTLSGPATVWPPNHRLVAYTLTAAETAGEMGDGLPHGVTISYSVGVSDGGSTKPAPSAEASPPTGGAPGDFSVPVHFRLRAERSGRNARTYTIAWTASFDGGPHMCSSSGSGEHPFVVTVPRDRRK